MRRMYSENQIKNIVNQGIDENSIPLYEEIDIASSVTFNYSGMSDIEASVGYCKIRRTKENELYIVLNFSNYFSPIDFSAFFAVFTFLTPKHCKYTIFLTEKSH